MSKWKEDFDNETRNIIDWRKNIGKSVYFSMDEETHNRIFKTKSKETMSEQKALPQGTCIDCGRVPRTNFKEKK